MAPRRPKSQSLSAATHAVHRSSHVRAWFWILLAQPALSSSVWFWPRLQPECQRLCLNFRCPHQCQSARSSCPLTASSCDLRSASCWKHLRCRCRLRSDYASTDLFHSHCWVSTITSLRRLILQMWRPPFLTCLHRCSLVVSHWKCVSMKWYVGPSWRSFS